MKTLERFPGAINGANGSEKHALKTFVKARRGILIGLCVTAVMGALWSLERAHRPEEEHVAYSFIDQDQEREEAAEKRARKAHEDAEDIKDALDDVRAAVDNQDS